MVSKELIIGCDDVSFARRILIRELLKRKIFFTIQDDIIILTKDKARIHLQQKPKLSEIIKIANEAKVEINFPNLVEPTYLNKVQLYKMDAPSELIVNEDRGIKYSKHLIKRANVINMQKIKKCKR